MAGKMGLEVLIEGIETSEQFAYLKQRHCDYFQGYYFAAHAVRRPLRILASPRCLLLADRRLWYTFRHDSIVLSAGYTFDEPSYESVLGRSL